ncbi:MAG: hypothetical protein K2K66_07110 [Ruminococcus sp.]|nr:hypothetical protein [Ruminococcus sp.]
MKEYIENLKFEDIPWEKMFTAYGTAEKFPEFFSVLEKMQSIDEMKEAFYGIMQEVEHQDTLYQPLPFVMIFFKRLLKKAENIHTPESEWLVEEIQHIFKRILDTCDYNAYEFSHGDRLWHFSDLLDKKYFPPNYYYLESAETIDPLDYEYSIVYYTKKIIDGRF